MTAERHGRNFPPVTKTIQQARNRERQLPFDELPDFLTVEEAAAVLRIGRGKAYELARVWRATGGREGLPVVVLGRSLRVPRDGLRRLLRG